MFVILEYVNYRKEQSMKYYGYFNDKDLALGFAQDLAERHCSDIGFDFITDNSFFDNNYLYIKPTDKSKIIKEFTCASFEKLSDESIKEIMSKCEENETVSVFITDCAGKIKFPKYESIKGELIREQTVETVRNILEYIAIQNPTHRCFGPEITERSSQVFSVIELNSLN